MNDRLQASVHIVAATLINGGAFNALHNISAGGRATCIVPRMCPTDRMSGFRRQSYISITTKHSAESYRHTRGLHGFVIRMSKLPTPLTSICRGSAVQQVHTSLHKSTTSCQQMRTKNQRPTTIVTCQDAVQVVVYKKSNERSLGLSTHTHTGRSTVRSERESRTDLTPIN